jgi:hypothetical protein
MGLEERAAIAAAINEHAAELDRMGALLEAGSFGSDLRDELTLLARAVLEVHDRQMPMMIALQRGDESLDDLRDRARAELVDRGHRYATRWLQKKIADGGFPDYDAEAVVAVALGSLLAYAAQKESFNGPPLGIDANRFVATWVEAWMRVAESAAADRDAG